MDMTTSSTQLYGITNEDIQRIFEQTLTEHRSRVIFLDCSYLYNFHLDDFEIVRKFNILGRYDKKAVFQWHQCLERWLADQTVVLANRTIKPIQIVRSFDRVVNEGLEIIAGSITGQDNAAFLFRMIGSGTVAQVLPSDRILADEINRINVVQTPDGGSLSKDGSTVYSIGNHPKSVESATITECGIANSETAATDEMLDHSKFQTPVTHLQDVDGPGSTTIIYMCSG